MISKNHYQKLPVEDKNKSCLSRNEHRTFIQKNFNNLNALSEYLCD